MRLRTSEWERREADRLKPYKVLVEQIGSYYHVQEAHALRKVSYSSFETAMNDEAIPSLTSGRTSQQKLTVKGYDVSVDAPILLPNYTLLDIEGKWKLAAGVNNHMITNTGSYLSVGHVTIQGGLLDGDPDNQTVDADLIELNGTSDNTWNVSIRDIHILSCRGYGLTLNKMGLAHVDHINIMPLYGTSNRVRAGFHFSDVFDSYFSNFLSSVGWGTGGVSAGLWMEHGTGHCQTNDVMNFYSGGGYRGIRLTGVWDTTFSNCQVLDNSRDGIYMEDNAYADYCYFNQFMNMRVMDAGQETHNTYDGVSLTGYSKCNKFTNLTVSEAPQGGHANKAAYDFNEDSANCDYNSILNSTLIAGVTGHVRLQGAHSHYAHTDETTANVHSIETQTQTGSWANPTGTAFNGRTVLVYNSTQVQYRLYCYQNSGWRAVELS